VIDRHDREPAELIDAWPTLSLVAEAAAAAGADVHVLQAARTRGSYAARGVRYTFVPELRVRLDDGPGLMPWRLTAELRRIAPDVVHFHGLEAPFHLWAVNRGIAPVLVQDHATHPGRRGKRVRRWSLRRVAGFAFTSMLQAEALAEAGDLPSDARVFEILESSTRFTAGDRQEARQRTKVFGTPAVLWVGHLNANKDPRTILRAARAALKRLPELQLWCAFGRAELLPEVVSILRRDDELRAHVHLLGRVPHAEVETLCRACDLFVLGSHRESCGYALLEALACGLVPVVTDIPSFRRITGSGAVGALVPPGDVEGFAAALVAESRALDDTSRMRVLAHFEAHLSPQALGRELVRTYRALQIAGETR
jgi:glycosyltransferase involved in cell wall biosynthesis